MNRAAEIRVFLAGISGISLLLLALVRDRRMRRFSFTESDFDQQQTPSILIASKSNL